MPASKMAAVSPVMSRLSQYIAAAPRKALPPAALALAERERRSSTDMLCEAAWKLEAVKDVRKLRPLLQA